MRRDRYYKNWWNNYKQVPIGRKRYYETLRKPRFIWLHKKLFKLSDWLYDLAYNIRKFNKEYNEVEYQKMRYRTIYKTVEVVNNK